MSHRKWKVRIRHILGAIDRITTYTRGMDFETFRSDMKTMDAVVRNFEVIGEAVQYVPESLREKHEEIPWGVMRRMRNVLAHDYDRVRADILWTTIRSDLAPLVPLLTALLEEEEE